MKNLENLRSKIDSVDKKIVAYLNKRAGLTSKIGEEKKKKGFSIFSSDRERAVYERVLKDSKGPLTDASLKAIYREIMSASLAIEKPLNIAFLGPLATFSHLAAIKKFGNSISYQACNTIADVFFSVDRNIADYGVVPIENSIEGAISHTLDMLVDSNLKICSEIYLEIEHNLLAKCKKDQVKKIYSNPFVFGQCRQWLEHNMPGVETMEVSSTTKAAEIASKEKYAASISSSLAAKEYGLDVVEKNIQDFSHNTTRFLVIGNSVPGHTGRDKTSIVFSVKDRIGVLHDTLVPFKKYNINLTKIESRPSKKKAWKYYFFIDLDGHCQSPKVKKALEELEKNCTFLKVLGSYPVAKDI